MNLDRHEPHLSMLMIVVKRYQHQTKALFRDRVIKLFFSKGDKDKNWLSNLSFMLLKRINLKSFYVS